MPGSWLMVFGFLFFFYLVVFSYSSFLGGLLPSNYQFSYKYIDFLVFTYFW